MNPISHLHAAFRRPLHRYLMLKSLVPPLFSFSLPSRRSLAEQAFYVVSFFNFSTKNKEKNSKWEKVNQISIEN